jgi:hypothetical protein
MLSTIKNSDLNIEKTTSIHTYKIFLLFKKSKYFEELSEDILKYIIHFLDLKTIHKIIPLPNVMKVNKFQLIFCEKNYYYCNYLRHKGGEDIYENRLQQLKKTQYIETYKNIYEKTHKRIKKNVQKLLFLSHQYDKGTYGMRYKIYKEY